MILFCVNKNISLISSRARAAAAPRRTRATAHARTAIYRNSYFWILPRLFAFLREEKPTQHKTNREEPSGDRGSSSRRRRPRPSKLKVTAQARCIRPKCIPPAQNAAELAALTPSLIRLPLPLRVAYLRSCRHARIERMSCQWQVVRQASNRPSMFSATTLSTPPRSC